MTTSAWDHLIDAPRIDARDAVQTAAWAKLLNVDTDAIADAVASAGSGAHAVAAFLHWQRERRQQQFLERTNRPGRG